MNDLTFDQLERIYFINEALNKMFENPIMAVEWEGDNLVDLKE